MSRAPGRTARILAVFFAMTTFGLAVALVWTWVFVSRLTLTPIPEPELPAYTHPSNEPVSPLQVKYQLDLPGRGEIFPALAGSQASDYWPVAVLNISNTASRPVLQVISAQVHGWSAELRQTVVVGPHETRSLRLEPELLHQAFENSEIQRATLSVEAQDAATGYAFAEQRPVLLHSASDLYWGRKFANAQLLARWVTPHDDRVLRLVAQAERLIPGRHLRGYNPAPAIRLDQQVRAQAAAVFAAM